MLLILGLGSLGLLVAEQARERGVRVLGVRRQPPSGDVHGVPCLAGDCADPELYPRLTAHTPLPVTAVLLAANPGLRRGQDNRLARGAALAAAAYPTARLIYSGTTAVYADAQGGDADESGALADDPASRGLLAIETAVLQHPLGLVLRFPALVGPSRQHARRKVAAALAAGVPCDVAGDPDRPFSYCHERDAATLCSVALAGALGTGVLNAAAPDALSVRDYYHQLAAAMPRADRLVVRGDGSAAPSRRIIATRLHGLLSDRRFRTPLDET